MKKLLSFLAVTVLCVACLAGCNDSSSKSDASSSSSSSAVESSSAADSSSEASSKEESSSNADSSSNPESSSQSEEATLSVSISIDVSDILQNYDSLEKGLQSEEFVPKSGKILDSKEFSVEKDKTALDLLNKAAEENKIKIESKTTDYGTYVSGINSISEGSCGQSSGWMYKVNGQTPEVGVDQYKLNAGDKVEFFYICDYNKYYATQTSTDTTTQAAA